MNYTIKEIEKEDLYDYMYIFVNSWNETYKDIIDKKYLDKLIINLNENVEKQKNNFEKTKIEEPDYKRFLLYVNNEPVGIVAIWKSREEKYSKSGELCTLYILNKIQKQGFGKILFEKAKEELRKLNYNSMIIYCLKENPTNEFYKHMSGVLKYSKEKNIFGKNLIENIYYYEKI